LNREIREAEQRKKRILSVFLLEYWKKMPISPLMLRKHGEVKQNKQLQ
jgi:hypothetical protein